VATKFTLPISTDNGLFLSDCEARKVGQSHSNKYCTAYPYPHIVLDNFMPLEILDNIFTDFPEKNLSYDILHSKPNLEQLKRQIYPNQCGKHVREVFAFLNSAPFLIFLEGLTRIEGLIPDPYFTGGGIHEIYSGGFLGIHVDFRIHQRLNLRRRLNVLIYLNDNWTDSYGGHFEIWDKEVKNCVRKILPIMNRCIVFNTDDESYHGHPSPLKTPVGVSRKSIALYYYTSGDSRLDIPNYSTIFRARPSDENRLHLAAFISRVKNYLSLKELLPPILYRNLKKFYKKINKKS
jgi:hypothetical protein